MFAAGPCTAAVLAGVLVMGTSCRNDLDRVAQIEMPLDAPERVTSDAEYLFSDSGRVTHRLRAARIEEFVGGTERRTELSGGFELVFFDRLGQQRAVLTATQGRFMPDRRVMEAERNVVFLNARGERLETEQLTWLQDSARVRTDKPVRITRADDILHGEGMEASEDFSRYIVRRITGVLHASPKEG